MLKILEKSGTFVSAKKWEPGAPEIQNGDCVAPDICYAKPDEQNTPL